MRKSEEDLFEAMDMLDASEEVLGKLAEEGNSIRRSADGTFTAANFGTDRRMVDDGTHYFGGRYEEKTETFKTKITLESEESANAAA